MQIAVAPLAKSAHIILIRHDPQLPASNLSFNDALAIFSLNKPKYGTPWVLENHELYDPPAALCNSSLLSYLPLKHTLTVLQVTFKVRLNLFQRDSQKMKRLCDALSTIYQFLTSQKRSAIQWASGPVGLVYYSFNRPAMTNNTIT